MRLAVALVSILFLASVAEAKPVRVYKHPDGRLTIDYPTDQYIGTPKSLEGLPMVEMDSADLPQTRAERNKWRLNGSNQVFVDNTVIDPEEVKKQRREAAKTKLRALGLTAQEVQALTND